MPSLCNEEAGTDLLLFFIALLKGNFSHLMVKGFRNVSVKTPRGVVPTLG